MKLRVAKKRIKDVGLSSAAILSELVIRAMRARLEDDEGRRFFYCPVARVEGHSFEDQGYRPLTDVLPFLREQTIRDGIKRLEAAQLLVVFRTGNRWDRAVLESGKVQRKRTHRYHIPENILAEHQEEITRKSSYLVFEVEAATKYGLVEAIVLNLLEYQSAKQLRKKHLPEIVRATAGHLAVKIGVAKSTARKALNNLVSRGAIERVSQSGYKLMTPITIKIKDSYRPATAVVPVAAIRIPEHQPTVPSPVQEWHLPTSRFVTTGIPKLDSHINGFGDGELAFLLGQTGHGKTITMLNFAFGAAMAGFKPLVFSLEMTETDLRYRLLSRLFDVPCDMLRNGRLDLKDRWEALPETTKRQLSNIEIVEMRERVSTAKLAAKVRELQDAGDHPDVILLDQFSYIQPNHALSGDVNDWKNKRNTASDLEAWAKASLDTANPFSVWCLHQANGDVALEYGRESISGCKAVIEPAALVVGIGHTDLEPGKLRLFSLKNRHGNPFEITLPCDFRRMTVGRPAVDALALTA